MVDVRDLVAFDLKLLGEKRGRTYNAAGPRAKPRFTITPEIEAKALADWKRK